IIPRVGPDGLEGAVVDLAHAQRPQRDDPVLDRRGDVPAVLRGTVLTLSVLAPVLALTVLTLSVLTLAVLALAVLRLAVLRLSVLGRGRRRDRWDRRLLPVPGLLPVTRL